MKKLIANILTVLTLGASAQLTYVTTIDNERLRAPMNYDGDLNYIDNHNYLITFNSPGSTFKIINSDFSVYKTLSIDTAGWFALGQYLDSYCFSDHLYNSDDKVELFYVVKKNSGEVKTVVIDEDGTVLQTLNDVRLNTYNPFVFNGKTYFSAENNDGILKIYETNGMMPCTTCSSTETTTNKKAPEKVYDINVFPNPTTNQITLAINTDKTGMKVHIYSTDGKLVKSSSVVNGNNLIDTADLVTGTYIYNVLTDDELIHASQFIKK
jgi:hypothetical protein